MVLATCGPPLTDPSPENITGHWSTADHIGPVYDVVMNIQQFSDGNVSGDWSGKVSPVNVDCPPGLGATPTGPVGGTHTIVGISLAVLGIGDFKGQKISSSSFRGTVFSCGIFYNVTFTLIPGTGG